MRSATRRSPDRGVELFDGAPYFHVRKLGETIVPNGLTKCLLGHKISRGPNAKPDGVFAEWHWDGKRLLVENDRFGMFPLFYFATEHEFCVSPSIFKLLAEGAPREIDWAALAVYLRTGYYVGDDTCFKAIRTVGPNARLEWRGGQLQISGGYQFAKPQNAIAPVGDRGLCLALQGSNEPPDPRARRFRGTAFRRPGFAAHPSGALRARAPSPVLHLGPTLSARDRRGRANRSARRKRAGRQACHRGSAGPRGPRAMDARIS